MKKCNKIEEMIVNGNIELDLTVETNDEINAHLQTCDDCRQFINELNKISQETKSIEKMTVSDDFDYNLKRKLAQIKQENVTEPVKTIPFFSRMVYYASGIAAMMIAFLYVSSMGIFENNENSVVPNSPVSLQLVSDDQNNKPKTTITDSLENLRNNVANDEDMRLKVSTGE